MRVPTYQGNQVKSADSVEMGTSVKTSVENFGGGQANNLAVASKAASVYNEIYQEQKKRADAIKVTESEYKLAEFKNKLMNPIDGVKSKRSGNALKLMETVPEEFQKELSKLQSELTNDEQKALFAESAMKSRMSFDRELQDHVAVETIRYDDDTYKSFLEAKGNEISSNFRDLDLVESSVEDIRKKVIEKAGRDGRQDIKDQLVDKEVSKAYGSAIEQMISNDKEDVAKEYFDFLKKRGDIKDSDELTRLQKMVDEGANRKEAQTSVDKFVASGYGESKAYNEAAKITDSVLRKETEDRINEVYSRRDAARKDALEKTTTRYFNMVESGKDPRKDSSWQYLEPSQRNAVLGYMKRLSSGDEAVTDPQLYRSLKDMAANPETRTKFLKSNVLEYVNKLSKTEFTEIKDLQKSMRSGEFDLANDIGSRSDVFKKTMESLKIPKSKQDDYFLKLNIIEKNIVKARGKDLSPVEYQQEIDNLLKTEINTKGAIKSQGPVLNWLLSGFSSDKRLIDLSTEDIENLTYEGVPKSVIPLIERELMAAGQPASNRSVLETYKEKLREIHGDDRD
jgi:hypothetical protein